MPVINSGGNTKYTANPTRATSTSTSSGNQNVEETHENRVIVSFDYMDLQWMVSVNREWNKDSFGHPYENDMQSSGPIMAKFPNHWLDHWEEEVYVLIPRTEEHLNTLYSDILIKHDIKYKLLKMDKFKYDPEHDAIYVINTDFIISSDDIKEAMRSKTTAFDVLSSIIADKTDIFDLFLIMDAGVLNCMRNSIIYPERPKADEQDKSGSSDEVADQVTDSTLSG